MRGCVTNLEKTPMTTTTQWSPTDLTNAKYIGTLEIEGGGYFEIIATHDKLVFGGACNAGLIESGFIMREDGERTDETLQELHADLETYYRDGASYVSRIVCNERM
jgi:hypothetical protein